MHERGGISIFGATQRQHRRQILIGKQRNHHRRIPTNNVARIRSKSIEKRALVVQIVLLCEETDKT